MVPRTATKTLGDFETLPELSVRLSRTASDRDERYPPPMGEHRVLGRQP
jgi:hypothetical protein